MDNEALFQKSKSHQVKVLKTHDTGNINIQLTLESEQLVWSSILLFMAIFTWGLKANTALNLWKCVKPSSAISDFTWL